MMKSKCYPFDPGRISFLWTSDPVAAVIVFKKRYGIRKLQVSDTPYFRPDFSNRFERE